MSNSSISITCAKCKLPCNDPRILPCNNTVCHSCARAMYNLARTLMLCALCQRSHNFPPGEIDFPVNQTVTLIIERRAIFNDLARDIQTAQKVLANVHASILSADKQKHVDELKEEIAVIAEEARQSISQAEARFMRQLDEYRNSLQENRSDERLATKLEEEANKLAVYINNWRSNLTQPDSLNLSESKKAIEQMNRAICKLKFERIQLEASQFGWEAKAKFERNEDLLDEGLVLGQFVRENVLTQNVKETVTINFKMHMEGLLKQAISDQRFSITRIADCFEDDSIAVVEQIYDKKNAKESDIIIIYSIDRKGKLERKETLKSEDDDSTNYEIQLSCGQNTLFLCFFSKMKFVVYSVCKKTLKTIGPKIELEKQQFKEIANNGANLFILSNKTLLKYNFDLELIKKIDIYKKCGNIAHALMQMAVDKDEKLYLMYKTDHFTVFDMKNDLFTVLHDFKLLNEASDINSFALYSNTHVLFLYSEIHMMYLYELNGTLVEVQSVRGKFGKSEKPELGLTQNMRNKERFFVMDLENPICYFF